MRRRFAADFTGWEKDNQTFETQMENFIHYGFQERILARVTPVRVLPDDSG